MKRRLPLGLLCTLAPLLLAMAGTAGAQTDGDYITCYSYTWTGKNKSVDCEDHLLDIMNEPQPCLDTLVYTTPYFYPPNTTDLQNHCSTVEKCPSYTCKEKGKSCIKLMWYDITNTLVNYSSFCGTVADVTNPEKRKGVTDVEYEMEVGTFTKKLKVCSEDLCNAAGTLRGSPGTLAAAVMAAVMAVVVMRSNLASE